MVEPFIARVDASGASVGHQRSISGTLLLPTPREIGPKRRRLSWLASLSSAALLGELECDGEFVDRPRDSRTLQAPKRVR
jgi:hypothetical protein